MARPCGAVSKHAVSNECLRSKLGAVMRDYESIGKAFRMGDRPSGGEPSLTGVSWTVIRSASGSGWYVIARSRP